MHSSGADTTIHLQTAYGILAALTDIPLTRDWRMNGGRVAVFRYQTETKNPERLPAKALLDYRAPSLCSGQKKKASLPLPPAHPVPLWRGQSLFPEESPARSRNATFPC